MDFRDGKHDENYIEWKYFNFVQENLAGYIIYYVLDPERKTGIGGGRLLVRIFKDGTSFGTVEKIDMDRVQLDQVSAGIVMGNASIVEHDPHHYEICSDSKDISWRLQYAQRTPTVDSFDLDPGLMSWEKASWLIKMPRADVRGELCIGGDTFRIDGLGYSDANWGELMPFFSKFEWGQYNDERVSLVFGVLFRLGIITHSYVYFTVGEHVVPMEDGRCSIRHVEWTHDKESGLRIPSRSEFMFAKDGYEVAFDTELVQSDSLGLKIHALLPKTVVSEQLVRYHGTIRKDGAIINEFHGEGFEEWTTKTWKKVAAPF